MEAYNYLSCCLFRICHLESRNTPVQYRLLEKQKYFSRFMHEKYRGKDANLVAETGISTVIFIHISFTYSTKKTDMFIIFFRTLLITFLRGRIFLFHLAINFFALVQK